MRLGTSIEQFDFQKENRNDTYCVVKWQLLRGDKRDQRQFSHILLFGHLPQYTSLRYTTRQMY